MKRFYEKIVQYKKCLVVLFTFSALLCLWVGQRVAVNYDIADYLPSHSPSSRALEVMEEEFEGGIPNARVMISNVTIAEALEYKEKLARVEGVEAVTWLDDAVNILQPLATLDQEQVQTYYQDNTALFTVTIKEDMRIEAVQNLRELIGEDQAMSGSAVSTAISTTATVSEVQLISVFAVLFVLVVLVLTTTSWVEPIIVLVGLGVAIAINKGTNLMFGEISFVTNAAGSILQLAVSLDYSVFLLHRFEECRQTNSDVKSAMVEALGKSTLSILSSGLTTVIGFLALVLMQFRLGPDLGLALAKGVAISLIVVFTFMPALILLVYRQIDRTKHRPFVPKLQSLGKWVSRLSMPLVILFALVIVPSYLASNANDYYYGASHIFNETTQLGADTLAIEKRFGQNDTYVLLLPQGDLATETKLSQALNELPQVKSIISYVDLAGAEIPLSYLDETTRAKLMSEHYSRMVLSVNVPYEGEETFSVVETIRHIANQYYPDDYYLAGEGVSTYDLMKTISTDMTKVNLVAILAVFIVLVFSLKSVLLPIFLVLSIETAIWLNLAIPYFSDTPIFYIAYLIISSIQLGATVDYAILMTDRYRENRMQGSKKEAVIQTIMDVTVSILTSGSTLTVVGLLMGYISSNQLLGQLGLFIGRGAIFSLIIVLFVLPGILYLFDHFIIKSNPVFLTEKEGEEVEEALA
ncbi:efflux RND transporter permease subunit [Turicibacter sp. TA25]|uniref:efflux RND transporter permease subunit n=1 Tax=Turicibacter sp. TA25 TaxID=2951142 RepID=UPI0021D4C21F|nr:MMPL family transporter [Turicibacter sp. TA25]MCU7204398.1 MMPL family transporter [Turicibacter sp. TA25]